MKNGIVIGTIACVVAIILIGSALAPIINMTTTTTTTYDNDGAVGLRMDKVSSGDFTINYGMVGDAFTATNGTDTQVIDDLCIFYADDNVAVWMDDSSVIMLGKDADNNTIDEKLSDESTITITKSSVGLEITDGTITQTFPVPTSAYVPKSTGSFGFFLNETEINTAGLPVQYVGSFAGVNCYNSINSFDLPITLDAALTDSVLSGAKWIKQAETAPEELNPDDLHIIPLDPSIIDPITEPDASVMGVPTPTYTDGDWGYDLYTSGQNNGKAKIVSYSGAGGTDIVIPAVVGGYDVVTVGAGFNKPIFQNTVEITNLTISEGIKTIETSAFQFLTKLTGKLVLPSTLISIGQDAFYSNKYTGNLILPDGLLTIGSTAFASSGFNGTILVPESVTSIANSFMYMRDVTGYVMMGSPTIGGLPFTDTGITQYLNFGDTVLSNGTYGISNNPEIRQGENANIPALGYLATLQYKETVKDDGPASVLLNVIPLITIVGILLFAVGFTIYRRNY